MKFIAIIPARYQSTRFPGKPLANIAGKTMIEWVVTKAKQSIENVFVATDDDRIIQTVERFDGNAIKTSTHHKSGTDRCAEAAKILKKSIDFDVVINLQGDEPFVEKSQIEALQNCFTDQTQIATLVKQAKDLEEVNDPNRPKVVIDKSNRALYFSRSIIPNTFNKDIDVQNYLIHIGMYAYKYDVLQEITKLPQGNYEKAEQLEQLRWLENNYNISVAKTIYNGFGIDTPDDLKRAEKLLNL